MLKLTINAKKVIKVFTAFTYEKKQRKEHGAPRGSGTKSVDFAPVRRSIDDKSLTEKHETSKHFLVDSQLENANPSNFCSAMGTLDTKVPLEKFNMISNVLKHAAKLNRAFGLVLKNVEGQIVGNIMRMHNFQ